MSEKETKQTGYQKVKAGQNMSHLGWDKAVTWLEVRRVGDQKWTVTEYDFDIGAYQCDNCRSNEFMWLVLQANGVYLACTGCTEVAGPLTKDMAIKVDTKNITPEKAYDILVKRGIRPSHKFEMPAGLMKDIKKRRVRVIRRTGKHKRPTRRG